MSKCKGPAFIIWNHQSRRDHAMLVRAAWPRRINFLAEEASFFRSHLATVFKLNEIIPKKVLSNDLSSLRAIRDVIKQNGVVAFAPEGFATVFGDHQPIVPGTGRFLQVFGIPVYFASLQGGYLSTSKFSKEDRPGKFCTQLQLLFSPDDLRKMTPQQIEDKINSLLHHDDFEWNKEHHYRYVSKEGMCTNLSDACYRCDDKHHQHRIAQPLHFLRIAVLVLLPTETGEDVLKDAQWTDNGTIDTSEDEGQQ